MKQQQKTEALLKAGSDYEVILDELGRHSREYMRLVRDIGVRESSHGPLESRAIALPELPGIEVHESAAAERLLSIAAELTSRPFRVAPYVDREELTSLVPLKSREGKFSPERLAQELARELLGVRGLKRACHQAAKQLKRYFGPHLSVGAALCVAGVQVTRSDRGRMLDAIASLRLADWLINFTAVLEAAGLSEMLAGVDELIEEIDSGGRAIIRPYQAIEEEEHVLRFSLRKDRLLVHLSKPLQGLMESFVEEHQHPVEPAAEGESPWFRAT